MKIGFIGLGNVGSKLAGSLLRNKFDLTVRDLDKNLTKQFENLGAKVVHSAKELAEQVDLIITCLPSPKICADVMEGENGILEGISKDKIWLEMSTTDEAEIKRIGKKVSKKNGIPLDGPVSGGCHRAATGNIAIFVGGERDASLSPPTKIAIFPVAALWQPPLTGPSKGMPFFLLTFLPILFISASSVVLISSQILSLDIPSNIPFSPSITSAQILGEGRQVIIKSTCSANSFAE